MKRNKEMLSPVQLGQKVKVHLCSYLRVNKSSSRSFFCRKNGLRNSAINMSLRIVKPIRLLIARGFSVRSSLKRRAFTEGLQPLASQLTAAKAENLLFKHYGLVATDVKEEFGYDDNQNFIVTVKSEEKEYNSYVFKIMQSNEHLKQGTSIVNWLNNQTWTISAVA